MLAVGAAGVIGWKSFPKEDFFFVTTLSISDIADKQQADDYTLTLVLEDSLVQEYGLPDRQLTLSAKDSLWQQVEPQSGFVGATLEVTIPAGAAQK